LVDLCKRRYDSRYSPETADVWLTNVVLKNPIQYYATRSADAFQITNLTTTPWTPATFKADIVFVAADHGRMWQILPLLRDSINWARDRRAAVWRFETETDFDLAPIMRRLGATDITPRYHLEL
jgi:hypothetical protein